MKKLFALLLVFSTLLVLVACANVPTEPVTSTEVITETQTETINETSIKETTEEPVTEVTVETMVETENEYINGKESIDHYLSYSEVQKTVDESRDKIYSTTDNLVGYEEVFKLFDDPTAKGLLTREEIDALKTKPTKTIDSVTHEEAVYDVDVLFRMLKYGYGLYYYFGGYEVFNEAKEKILNEIEDQESIKVNNLAEIVNNNLSFIIDTHFSINGLKRSSRADDKLYIYFYCDNQNYTADEEGYYKFIDGVKWYYDGCDRDDVTMQLHIDDEGHIVYSPVLFTPRDYLTNENDIFLKCGDVTKKQTIIWKENKAKGTSGLDFKYYKEKGVAYISVRSFNNQYEKILNNDYIKTGTKVKDAKVIIYDLRSNSGGNSTYPINWVKNFTDQTPNVIGVWADRHNCLWDDIPLYDEYFELKLYNGKRIDNEIPIILIVDRNIASSGELAYLYTSSIRNVIIIGSNTSGCELCGNCQSFYLPNTKMLIYFGKSPKNWYDLESKECTGFMPDIWVDGASALDLVYNFIVTQGLATKDEVNSLKRIAK